MQTVKDLSVDELKVLIAEVVEERVRELLAEFDMGFPLQPEFLECLLRELRRTQQEGETFPAAIAARRRDLES